MLRQLTIGILGAATLATVSAPAAQASELPPYLQCVPYARDVSGIQIYGDAHTWWHQAAGKFQRGTQPRVGAVMAFRPHRNMRLGHVAAVSRIIDSRTLLLSHANWSPINGRRGQIERDVKAVDVSPANDWSQVRVWYHPIQALGKTAWPVHGFIYGKRSRAPQMAQARGQQTRAPVRVAQTKAPSKAFLSAFADLGTAKRTQPAKTVKAVQRSAAVAVPARVSRPAPAAIDPISAAIARYDK